MERNLVFIAAGLSLILAIASAGMSVAFRLAAVACVVLLLAIGLWRLRRPKP